MDSEEEIEEAGQMLRGVIVFSVLVVLELIELVYYYISWPGSPYLYVVFVAFAFSIVLATLALGLFSGYFPRLLRIAIPIAAVYAFFYIAAIALIEIHLGAP